jgi:FkbM family methyltransferase
MIETKSVNGFLWPEEDVDCARVVFDWLEHLDLALKHVKNFDVAVQAGGNCGVWPKALGMKFGTVYTYEPEPRNFYCLAHNCWEDHIIKIQAALGDAYERPVALDYVAGERNLGAVAVGLDPLELQRFPVMCIDDLGLRNCDLIQLDIEGYEPLALKGAQATIQRCEPVIMVEDKGLSEKYGFPKGWSEDYALLTAMGYQITERAIRDVVLVCDA